MQERHELIKRGLFSLLLYYIIQEKNEHIYEKGIKESNKVRMCKLIGR